LTTPAPLWRRVLFTTIKFGVVIGAFAWLILSDRLNLKDLTFRPGCGARMAAGVALLLAASLLAFLRYRLLLGAVDIALRTWDVIRLGMIGAFFNTFLLGGLGGDAVKLAYVMRETGKRAGAAASIFVDRMIGMLGLILLGGLALLWSWSIVLATPTLHTLTLAVFGAIGTAALAGLTSLIALEAGRRAGLGFALLLVAGAGVFCGFALRGDELALSGEAAPEALLRGRALLVLGGALFCAFAAAVVAPSCQPERTLYRVFARVPGGRAVNALIESLLAYRSHLGALAGALGLSVILQSLGLTAIWCFGGTLALLVEPAPAQIFFAAPPALVANALPVPGGGLGVGEAAFDQVLRLCRTAGGESVEGGAAIFLLNRFWSILIGLFGFPIYLRGKREIQALMRESDEAAQREGG